MEMLESMKQTSFDSRTQKKLNTSIQNKIYLPLNLRATSHVSLSGHDATIINWKVGYLLEQNTCNTHIGLPQNICYARLHK
jgi:hypothetical protein